MSHTPNQSRLHQSHEKRPKLRIPTAQIIGLNTTSSPTALPSNKRSPLKTSASEVTTPVHILSVSHLQTQKSTQISSMTKMASSPLKPPTITLTSNPASHQGSPTHNLSTFKGFPTRKSKEEISTWRPKKRRTEPNQLESPLTKGSRIEAASAGMKKRVVHSPTFHITTPEGMSPILTNPKSLLETFTEASPHKRISTKGSHQSQQKRSTMPYATIIKSPCARGAEEQHTDKQKILHNKAKEGLTRLIKESKVKKRSRSVHSLKQMSSVNSMVHLPEHSVMMSEFPLDVAKTDKNILRNYRHGSKPKELGYRRLGSGDKEKHSLYSLFTSKFYSKSMHPSGENSGAPTIESFPESMISDHHPLHHHPLQKSVRKLSPQLMKKDDGFVKQLSPFRSSRPAYDNYMWSPPKRTQRYEFGSPTVGGPKTVEVVLVGNEWKYAKDLGTSVENSLGELTAKHSGTGSRSNSNAGRTTKYNVDKSWTKLGRKSEEDYGGNIQKAKKGNIYIKEETTGYARGGSEYILARDIREEKKEVHVRRRKDEVHGYKGDSSSDIKEELEQAMLENERNRQKEQFLRDFRNKLKVEKGKYKLQQDSDYYNILADEQEEFEEEEILENSEVIERDQYVISEAGEMAEVKTEEEQYKERYRDDEGASRGIVQEKVPEKKKKAYRHVVDEEVEEHIVERIQDVRKISRVERKEEENKVEKEEKEPLEKIVEDDLMIQIERNIQRKVEQELKRRRESRSPVKSEQGSNMNFSVLSNLSKDEKKTIENKNSIVNTQNSVERVLKTEESQKHEGHPEFKLIQIVGANTSEVGLTERSAVGSEKKHKRKESYRQNRSGIKELGSTLPPKALQEYLQEEAYSNPRSTPQQEANNMENWSWKEEENRISEDFEGKRKSEPFISGMTKEELKKDDQRQPIKQVESGKGEKALANRSSEPEKKSIDLGVMIQERNVIGFKEIAKEHIEVKQKTAESEHVYKQGVKTEERRNIQKEEQNTLQVPEELPAILSSIKDIKQEGVSHEEGHAVKKTEQEKPKKIAYIVRDDIETVSTKEIPNEDPNKSVVDYKEDQNIRITDTAKIVTENKFIEEIEHRETISIQDKPKENLEQRQEGVSAKSIDKDVRDQDKPHKAPEEIGVVASVVPNEKEKSKEVESQKTTVHYQGNKINPIEKVEVVRNPKEAVSSIEAQEEIVEVKSIEKTEEGKVKKAQIVKEKTQKSGETNKKEEKIVQEANQQISQNVSSKEIKEQKQSVIQKKIEDISTELKKPEQVLTDEIKRETEKQNIVKGDQAVAATIESEGINQTATQELQQKIETSSVSDKKTHEKGQKAGPEVIKPTVTQSISKDAEEKKEEKLSEATPITVYKASEGVSEKALVEKIKKEEVKIDVNQERRKESTASVPEILKQTTEQKVLENENKIETSSMQDKKKGKTNLEIIEPANVPVANKNITENQGEKLVEASPINVQKSVEAVAEKAQVEEIKERDSKLDVNQERQKESAANVTEIVQQTTEQEVLENENEIETSPVSGKKKKKKSKKAKAETVESAQEKVEQDILGQKISDKGTESNQVERAKKEFIVEVKDTESKAQKTVNVNQARDVQSTNQKIIEVSKGNESETAKKQVINEKGERQINLGKTPQEIAGKVTIEEVKEQAVTKKDTENKLGTVAAQTASQDTKLNESEIVTSPVSQAKKNKGKKTQGENKEQIQEQTSKNVSSLEVQNKVEEIRQVNTGKEQRTSVEEIKQERVQETSKKSGQESPKTIVTQEIRIGDQEVKQSESEIETSPVSSKKMKTKKSQKAEPEVIKPTVTQTISKDTGKSQGEKLMEASPISVQKISEGVKEKVSVEEIKEEDVKSYVNQKRQKESASNLPEILQQAIEQEVLENENEIEISPVSGKKKKKKSKKAKAETVESVQGKINQETSGQEISNKGIEINQVESVKKEFAVEVKDTESKVQKTANVNVAKQAKDDAKQQDQKILDVNKGKESETPEKEVVDEKGERQINLEKTPQEIAGKVPIEEVKEQAVMKKDTTSKLETIAAQTAGQDTKLDESEIVTSPVSQVKKTKGTKVQGESQEKVQVHTPKNSILEVQNKAEEIRQVNTDKGQRTVVEEIKTEIIKESSKKTGAVSQEVKIVAQAENKTISDKIKKEEKAEPESIKSASVHATSKYTEENQGEKLVEASPINVQKISEGNEEKAYVEEIKKEDVKADVNQEKQKESAANIMDKLQTATEQEVPEDENEVEASPMSGKRKKKKSKTKAGSSAEQGVETLDNKRSIQPEPVTDKVSTEKVKAETDTNKKPEKESLSVESISKDTEKKLEKMEEVMKQVSPSILQKASERIEEKVLIEEIKEQPKSMEGVKQEKPKKAVLNRPDVSQEVSAQANQKDNEMKKSDTVELVTEQEIPENEDEIESSPVSGKKKKKRSKKAKAGTSEQQIIDPLEVKTSIQPQPAVDKVSTGKIQEEEIKVDVKQERQKEYAASVSETLQQATKQEALGNEIGIETIPVSEKKSKDKKAKVEAEAETDKDSSTNITKESKNEDLTIQSLSAEKRIQEKQDIVKEESSSRLQKVPERSEEKAHIEEIKEESNQGKLKGAILTQPDISHEMNTQANQKDNEMKNSDIAEHEVPENENEIETSPVSGKKRKNRSKKARAGISEEQTVEPLEVKSSIKHEAVAEKISVDEIKEQNTNKQELSKEKESLRVESRSKNTEKNNEKKQEVITEVSSSILQKEPGSEEKVRIEEIKVGVKKEKLKETPVAKPEMSQEVDVQATQKDNEMNKPDIVELITEQEVPENENEIETSPVSGKKKKNWSKKAKAGTSEDQMVEPLEVKSSIKPEAVIENVSVEENKEQNINKQELEKEKEKESVIDKQEMSQQVTEQEAPENENEIEVSPLSGKKKKKKGKKSQAEVDTCITKEQAKESLIVESISKEIEKNIEMKQEVIREISSSILQNVPERIEEKVHIEEIKEDVKREKSKEIAGTKPEISQEVFAQANQKDNELKMPDTGIAEVVMEQEVPENENEIETSPVSGKRKKNKSKKAKTGINKEQVVVTLEVKSSIKPETVAEKISVEEIKEQNISKQDLEKEKVIEANKLEIQHQTIEQETPENENEVEASPVSGKKKKKKNKKAKPETGADTSKGPEKETLVLESLNKEAEGSIVNIQSEAPKETSSVLQKAPEISEEKINIKEHDKEIKEEKQGTTTSEPETVQKMTIQDAKEEEENEIETTPVSGKKKKNKSKKTKAETNINTNKEPEQEGLTIRSIKKDAEKIIEKEQEVIKPESSSTLQKAPERIEEKANIEEIKEHDKVKEGVSEENQETAAIDQDVKEKENEVEASPVSGKNKKKKGKKAKAEADIGAGKETEKASLTIESISKDTDKRVEKKQEVIKEESSSTLQKSPERSEEKVGIEEIKEQDKTQEDFKERKYQEAAVTEPEIIEHVTAQNPKEEENEIETSPVSGKKKKKKGIKTKAEADIGANKEPEKEGLTIESISKDTDKSVEKKQEVIKEESSSTLQKAPERSEEKVSIKKQDNVQEDGKKEKQHSAIVTAPEIIQQVTARDIQQKENEAEVSRVSDKKKKKKDKKGKAEVQEDATEKKADQILNVPSLSKPEEIVEKVTIEEIKEEKENVTSKPELPLQIAGQRVQENENEIDTSPVSGNKKKRKGKKAKPETGADTKEELEKKGLVPESLIKDIETGLEKNQAEILKEVPSSTIQQAPERAKEKVQIEEIKEQSKAQEDLKERKHQETVVIGAEIPEHVTAQEAKKENDIETTPISGNKKEGKKAQVETIEEVIRISTKETEIAQGENIVKEEIKVRKDVEEKMHKTVHAIKEDEHTLKQQEIVRSKEGIESKKQAYLSTIEAPAKQVVIEEIKEQDKGGVFEAKQEVNISSHQEVSQPVANEEVQLDRGESPVSDDKRKNKETVAKKGVQEDIKVQKEKVSNIEPQKEVEHVVDVTVKEEVQEKKDGLKVEEAQKELHVQKPREVQKEKQRAHDGQNSELKNILKAEEKPRVEEPTKIEAKISESKEAENVPERIEIPKNITVESASKDSLPTISNRLEVQTQKQLNVESESLQNVVEESLEKGKELSNKVNLSEDKKEEMKKEENIKETERVQEEIVMNTVITKIENAVEQTQEERQETKKLEKPNEEEPKIKVSHPEDNKEEPQKPKEESIEVLRKEEEKQKQTEFECNEPIPDQTIKTIKRNVEEQRAQDTEEKSKKILEEESEIEESIRESESKTVEKEYPLIVVREETSFQTRTYEGHEHSHELTRPGAVLHKSIFSTCNSRSQLFEEEENSEEKATNLEGTHIETIASQEILPEEKRVQNVRNQQETKIHQTEVHITHEKAVEEHKEEPKAPEWKERETEKVHEKPVENQEKKAKAFPRRFYGFDYSGLVNVNLNNSNSSKTIEESPRLTTSQTIKLSDLDNKSVSAIHLHRIDTQESDNLPSDLMRSNWLLHGLKDSAHGEEEKHEHGRSSFVNSAQNSARNSGGNQLNTSFESLKRSTESPGRKEPVETDWRTLAMKQSHLMRVSFSPTFSPSAEAREHRDDPVTHLSAMYENNISKVETLKRLDNKEGAIQLMRDIIAELDTHKEKHGELEPDEANTVMLYKIHAHNRLALELYEHGEYNEVLLECKKVIDMDKSNLQALYKAYQANIKLNNKDKTKLILTRIRKLMQMPMVLQYNKQFLLDNLSLPTQSNSQLSEDMHDSRLSHFSLGS